MSGQAGRDFLGRLFDLVDGEEGSSRIWKLATRYVPLIEAGAVQSHPVAPEIMQRHVEAAWPPYLGRNRAGTQCAFCNRTWPCDAARLLRAAAPDPADLARWLQEWAEKQPAITIRRGVSPQVAWRALADELLRRWGR